MTIAKKYSDQEKVQLNGRLAEFREALEEEIDEVKKSGQTSTLLNAGKRIESNGEGFWYRFLVEYMPVIPADTPCKIIIGTDQYEVSVISVEENAVIISSKNRLPANIGKARLENGSTVLMERLIKSIEDNAEKTNPAGDRLFRQSNGQVYNAQKLFHYDDIHYADHSNSGQKKAVRSALEHDITYIWGPPGTGKTTVIGNIIEELYKRDRSVLIVSHTNTAVDGAVQKADDLFGKALYEAKKTYPILRLGISVKNIPERTSLSSHVEVLGKELFDQKKQLEIQQQNVLDILGEIRIVLAKNKWLKENRIGEIQDLHKILLQWKEKECRFSKQAGEKRTEIEKAIRDHPELEKYIRIEDEYQEAVDEKDRIAAGIASIQEQIGENESKHVQAEDEIKKHVLYEELTLELQHFLSSQHYKNEIAKLESSIKMIETRISTLTTRKKTLEDAIRKYESKRTLAKVFAGKSVYEQNQRNLKSVISDIGKASEEKEQKQKLINDYKKQLSDRQLLEEKRKALTPSKTKNHWISEEKGLSGIRNHLESSLRQLYAEMDVTTKRIHELEDRKRDKQGLLDAINTLKEELESIKRTVNEAQKTVSEKTQALEQLIRTERDACEQFSYELENEGIKEIVDELSLLLVHVRRELNGIDIQEKEKQKEDEEKELSSIKAQISEIMNKMAELEKQAVMNAKVIGTTLAKSYLDETLRLRGFDTVILDEASMASIPSLWCAAYLAERNIVIVGDFLQLPPIVMAKKEMATKWLGRDVFDHSGMQERARRENQSRLPDNFAILNQQYRMESDIADIANLYYGGYTKLVSNDLLDFRVKERREFYDWYSGNPTKDHIHLIDTESLHAWVTGIPQAKSHSRLNCFSASLDVDLAFRSLKTLIAQLDPKTAKPIEAPKVLIVAPYKPHVNLINKLITNEYLCRGFSEDLNLVRAGTIHSFQGSEAEIVIFDLVIDEPHYKANILMSKPEINDGLKKMFNVAVTRAKFKLFIVGDFDYCQKRAKDNALAQLLDYLIGVKKYKKVDAKSQFLPKLAVSSITGVVLNEKTNADQIICTESEFNQYFLSDVHSFKERLIIYSPFMTENRISVLLPEFYNAISQGKRIVVITKTLEERGKKELAQYKMCEKGLRDMGVSILLLWQINVDKVSYVCYN